jgi:hypothetical protein
VDRARLNGGLWPVLLPHANVNRQGCRLVDCALVIGGSKHRISENGIRIDELLH